MKTVGTLPEWFVTAHLGRILPDVLTSTVNLWLNVWCCGGFELVDVAFSLASALVSSDFRAHTILCVSHLDIQDIYIVLWTLFVGLQPPLLSAYVWSNMANNFICCGCVAALCAVFCSCCVM